MKKLLLVMLVLLVSATLVFANSKGEEESTGSTAGTMDPVTFTYFNVDSQVDMPFTDPIALKIQEETGVTLDVDHPVAGDTQAIPLMMASGDLPDLIYAKGELSKLIEAGMVIPLDEMIEERGENIKALYGDQLVRLKNSQDDPHIYSFGTYGVEQGKWKTDGIMQIQHAVLKELGYPEINDLDDYADALRAYKAKYPTIDGQETIGLSLLIDTWQWYIDLSNPANYLIGYPDDGQWIINQDTLEATYKFLYPGMDKYYRWLSEINQEGLLDPESFTQKEDIWKAKIASGRVLGIAYPDWGYGDAKASLVSEGKVDRTYAFLSLQAEENGGTLDPMLKDYGFGGGWGIAITTACEDPERAFDFMDWMCSEEAQVLVNWGLEGVNYDMIDGVRVRRAEDIEMANTNPDYSKITGIGQWIYPFPQMGSARKDSTGNWYTHDSPQMIRDNYLDIEKETLAAYGMDMWIDWFPTPEELGVSRHGQAWQYALPGDVNAMITEADAYVKEALAKAVLDDPSNFDKHWAQIQEDLIDMGIEEANAKMTELVQGKVQMWNGN